MQTAINGATQKILDVVDQRIAAAIPQQQPSGPTTGTGAAAATSAPGGIPAGSPPAPTITRQVQGAALQSIGLEIAFVKGCMRAFYTQGVLN